MKKEITRHLESTGMTWNGHREGAWHFYNGKTGALYSAGTYKDGYREGTWRFYDEEGKVEKHILYLNGEIIEEW